MEKLLGILTLLLLLAACGQTETAKTPEKEILPTEIQVEPKALPESNSIQPAVLEGEPLSPGGQFLAQMAGHRESVTAMGLYPADTIQITDAETGEILWEGDGFYTQSILWSPEGGFAALARSARTWCSITLIETESWTEWAFTLPDGSPIPEYTFLPDGEPWGVWQSENSLGLTIGRGGDWGEQRYYTCGIEMRDGRLKGHVLEESRERLPRSYDFDHDGEPEIVELVTVYGDKEAEQPSWYELRVRTADNLLYWVDSYAEAHPGWGVCFACRVKGEDYLLRYLPTMYQGCASYSYALFSLTKTGQEQVVQAGTVDFDMNFNEMHESFKPKEIAAFLEEVHGLLADSELLLTTVSGEFRSGGPGAAFQDDLAYWTDDPLYDGGKSLEENIRAIGAYWKELRT
mgnify:CR=1 FL=1|nr:hypothetical protein [uncultured Oscillibacter sp.]